MSGQLLDVQLAMHAGERLVHDALQSGLIDLLADAPAELRYAAMSGVMCRITSLAVVLLGQEHTRRVLATSIEAASHAPADAVEAAQNLRDAIDRAHNAEQGVH